jgi:hypothetical protein
MVSTKSFILFFTFFVALVGAAPANVTQHTNATDPSPGVIDTAGKHTGGVYVASLLMHPEMLF